jgi:hypothetical protein
MRSAKTCVYDGAGKAVGYVKSWHGRWYAFECTADGVFRRGKFSDRTEAVLAVLAAGDGPQGGMT